MSTGMCSVLMLSMTLVSRAFCWILYPIFGGRGDGRGRGKLQSSEERIVCVSACLRIVFVTVAICVSKNAD